MRVAILIANPPPHRAESPHAGFLPGRSMNPGPASAETAAAAGNAEPVELESRIFASPAVPSPWTSFHFPAEVRADPRRNVLAGTITAVVTLPLAMGLGALAVAPFGPAFVSLGVVAGLYSAAFLGLITFLAGARGIAIYAPRSLVSFVRSEERRVGKECGSMWGRGHWNEEW